MTAFVKTGGSFRIGVINPASGQVDSFTPPQPNTLLLSGVQSLFTGLNEYLPIQIGKSSIGTIQTEHTGVVEPIALEINNIETQSIPRISQMPFDPTRILIVTGKTKFRVEVLEKATLNEVAISNFCRAVVSTPIELEAGNEIEIEYEFSIYLSFNTRDSVGFNGLFKDPVTDEISNFQARTAAVVLDPTEPYPWYELLSSFNQAFTIDTVDNILESESPRIPVDQLDTTLRDISQDTWITINGPSLPTRTIGSLYFGNPHFGMVTTFYQLESASIQPLPIPETHRLSLLFSIDWSNQEL